MRPTCSNGRFRGHSGSRRRPGRPGARGRRWPPRVLRRCTGRRGHAGVRSFRRVRPRARPVPAEPSGHHGGRQGQRRSARHPGEVGGQPSGPAGGQRLLLLAARQPPGDGPRGLLVGEPHARDAASAAGEGGALLARALRDQRGQGPGLPEDAPTGRAVPGARARGLPRAPGRRGQGPGHARLPRRGHQREGLPQRELRPGDHGAIHHGPRQLHGDGHPRRARGHSPAGTSAARSSRSTRRTTTTGRSRSWATRARSTART